MHSTELGFRRRVVWSAGLLVLVLAYALLCLADWWLARWMDRQITLANAPARAIEAQRAEQQDVHQLAAARAAGNRTMLFPALFEQAPFQAMMRRHGVLPLGAQPSASLVYCNEGAGLVTYVSDRFGFRNADAVWDAPDIGVALLGDSFVHGACVADGQTMAAHLAAAGQMVINLGTSGNNGLMHAAVARVYLPAIRPRHAVLVFYANDNEHEEDSVLRAWALPDAPDYLVRDAAGRLRPGPAYQRLSALWAEAEAEALHQQARQQAHHQAPAQGGQVEPVRTAATAEPRPLPKWLLLTALRTVLKAAWWRWTGEALPWSSRLAIDTLAVQCQQAGCRPALAYIPNSPFWRPDPRAEGYRQALRAYAAQRYPGMAWIDLSPGLAKLDKAAYASMGPHLSAAGYAVAAQTIDQALRQGPSR